MTGSHHGTTVHLYDAETGRYLRDLDSGTGYGVFQNHGQMILATGVDSNSFWEAATGNLIRRVPFAGNTIAFSPDDRCYVLSDRDAHLRLCRTDNDQELATVNYPATGEFLVIVRAACASHSTGRPEKTRWYFRQTRNAPDPFSGGSFQKLFLSTPVAKMICPWF